MSKLAHHLFLLVIVSIVAVYLFNPSGPIVHSLAICAAYLLVCVFNLLFHPPSGAPRIIYGDVKLLQEGRSRLRACVGVFDGHGGYEAADIAARQLLPKLVQSYYAGTVFLSLVGHFSSVFFSFSLLLWFVTPPPADWCKPSFFLQIPTRTFRT